jgi:biotin operon repressor
VLKKLQKQIINELQQNPNLSGHELSMMFGVSQPAIWANIKKIQEVNGISKQYGFNLKTSTEFHLALIRCNLIKSFDFTLLPQYPRILNICKVSGQYTTLILFIYQQPSEIWALAQALEENGVQKITTEILLDYERDFVVPIRQEIDSND